MHERENFWLMQVICHHYIQIQIVRLGGMSVNFYQGQQTSRKQVGPKSRPLNKSYLKVLKNAMSFDFISQTAMSNKRCNIVTGIKYSVRDLVCDVINYA